jgi:preprotein translocase subunit SecG
MVANVILAIHCLLAIAIVVLVLLQHGKGADMGAAFGSGSAGSLFGSSGAANFLSRSTAICAALFFATSLGLSYFHAPKVSSGVMGGVMATPPAKTEPAKDGKDAKDAGGVNSIPAPAATTAPAVPAQVPAAPVDVKGETKTETKSDQIPK